jgi:hypothetical protein
MSLCYDFQNRTIISLSIVAISLTVGLILMQYGHAQPVEFKTYTNNDINFTIQHPSNWQVKESTESPLKESTESPHGRVWFELSGRNLPIFAVDTEKVEPHF